MDLSYTDIPMEMIGESFSRFRLALPRSDAAMLNSIEKYGQLSPIVVSSCENGHYELIDGFKRLRVLRQLKFKRIRARVLECSGGELKIALIQLNQEACSIGVLEVAMVIASLCREEGMSQVEIARQLGRHKSWVSRRIALVERLSEDVCEHLRLGLIDITRARELLRLPRGNQKDALESVLKHHFTSRETNMLVSMLLKHPQHDQYTISRLSEKILDKRQTPDQPQEKPSVQPFDAALVRLEKCCDVVIQGVANNMFSEKSPRINEVVKSLEKTIVCLRSFI